MTPEAARDATQATQAALGSIAGLDQSIAIAQQAQADAEAQKKLAEKANSIVGSPPKGGAATTWRDAALALKVLGPADKTKGKGIADLAKEAADKAEAECKKQKDALKKADDTKDKLAEAIPTLEADAKDLKDKADALTAERDALEKKRTELRDAITTAKGRVKKAVIDKATQEAAAAEQYLVTKVMMACVSVGGRLFSTALNKAVEEEAAAKKDLQNLEDQEKQTRKDLDRKKGQANLAVPKAGAAKRAADAAKKAKSDLDAVLAKKKQLEDACNASTQANNAAKAAKDSVVQKRLNALIAEGHGPQRHQESDAAERRRKCGERALYKLDPETGTQVQVDGRIHVANQAATSIPSKDDYVRAEATCRMELYKQVKAGTADVRGQTIEPLLTDLFDDPRVDCTGLVDNRAAAARPTVISASGEVRQIPLQAPPPPPVFHPPPAVTYPPAPALPIPPFNADQRQMMDTAMENVVRQGGDPANFNAALANPAFQANYAGAYNNPVNAALPPKQRKAAAMTAALAPATAAALTPPPPLNPASPPATRAQMDTAAMDAAITNDTVAATFNDPTLTAFSLYKPVDPAKPRGDWTMTTLYPTCD